MGDLKEHIILPAWRLIKTDTKIKKAYFFPGLLSILFLTFLLVYQSIYTYVNIFNKRDDVLILLLDFFHSSYFWEILIVALIFLLLHVFIIPIFEGGLISYIDAKTKKEEEKINFSDVLGVGIYRFLPLFEYNNFSQFKIITVLNAYLFSLRFIGLEYIKYVSWIFIVVFLFSIIVHILFAYTKYEIVLRGGKVLSSIMKSSKIAILNPRMTIELYIMLVLLNIRVIFNFIIFLIFPVIIASAFVYITSKLFLIVALIVLIPLFLFFIIFLGYLASVLEIFKTAIWYHAYIEGEKRVNIYKDED